MSFEIKNHRLRWLGHVLRMPSDRIPMQYCLEMNPKWEQAEKTRAKNHLTKNNDERAREVGSNMGRSPGHSSGQSRVAKFDCKLVSCVSPNFLFRLRT